MKLLDLLVKKKQNNEITSRSTRFIDKLTQNEL